MKRIRWHAATLACLLAAHGSLFAFQQSPDTTAQDSPAAPVFRSRADLVVLHVNVFDRHSDSVPDLPASAFSVQEDGTPQEITFFSGEDVPVAVGLVVDNSGSMIGRRRMVLAGGEAFARSSRPGDEMFSIIFNEHVRKGLPDSVLFTQSHSMLMSALMRFPPGGQTALHDAVIEGLNHLRTASAQKRVLVVLSDGEDNASTHSEADMLARVSSSDALVYTIWTGDLSAESGDQGLLKKMARMSGGVAYTPNSEAEVITDFQKVAANIRHGYSLGYSSKIARTNGDYHRVRVAVRVPGRNLSVRVRDGYTEPETRHAN